MRRSSWTFLLLTLLAAAPAFSAPQPPSTATRKVIVAFRPGTTPEQRRQVLEKNGLQVDDDLDEIGAVIADAPRFSPNAVTLLRAEPAIFDLVEDFYAIWINEPASPAFQELPSLQSVREQMKTMEKPAPPVAPKPLETGEFPWGISRVNAKAAWAKTMGQNIKVAILDTGIDPTHPDLMADGKSKVAGGSNGALFGGSWADDHGHGTHVAGTVAAAFDGQGVVGIAPGVSLYAVKVLDKNGGGMLTSILKGFYWCVKNHMQVINMSLGSDRGVFVWHWLIEYAHKKGIVMVAAAGNSGGAVGYPAAYPEVISVAASDVDDKVAEFSSRGPRVDLIAPGVDVMSCKLGGGWARHSGTSMATPHITGLAALAIALGHTGGPEDVRAALKAAAVPLANAKPQEQGAGIVDASRLLDQARKDR